MLGPEARIQMLNFKLMITLFVTDGMNGTMWDANKLHAVKPEDEGT